jgi:hypothetical protein
MAEHDKLTLAALRARAKKALGAEAAKGKTKAQLLSALARAGVKAAAKTARGAIQAVARRTTTKKAAKPAKAAAKKAAGAKASAPSSKAPPRRPAKAGVPKAAARSKAPSKEPAAGPDPEGFFVARVAGEDAARDAPHPMAESLDPEGAEMPRGDPDALEEGLGELPLGYGDDSIVALPRDPRTLFVYWDLHPDTVRHAFDGLTHPRAELRVFAKNATGGTSERVRTLELAIESRSYYVHDLEPGRLYHAAIHAVGGNGDRLVARPSNAVPLPPLGPSPVMDDLFIDLPWDMTLEALAAAGALHPVPGAPLPAELRARLTMLFSLERGAMIEGDGPPRPGAAPRGLPGASPSSLANSSWGTFPKRTP